VPGPQVVQWASPGATIVVTVFIMQLARRALREVLAPPSLEARS
jgi:hypothetical protein